MTVVFHPGEFVMKKRSYKKWLLAGLLLLLLLFCLVCAGCGKAQPQPTIRITIYSPAPESSVPEEAGRAPSGEDEGSVPADGETRIFILNANNGKFHLPDCRAVKQMKESNRQEIEASYEEMVAQGYTPCDLCHPG